MTACARDQRHNEVHHPIFARLFDRLSRLMEPEAGLHRDRLLAGLCGRVIEVGAGNGVNFAHYPSSVEEVVAIEPEPYLRAKAEMAAHEARVAVRVLGGTAAQLPVESASFDAAVACLVLCTVPDVEAALGELRRVLTPRGELRFFEHVRAGHLAKASVQSAFDRSGIWPAIGGGCHCSRSTTETIASAGFRVTKLEKIVVGRSWFITNPHVLGTAQVAP